MPKRTVIVSVVALLVVAAAVVAVVATRAGGTVPAEAANRSDAAPAIGTAVTAPPVSTPPASPSTTTTTPASSSVAATTSSAAASGDAPLAGRIKPGASHSGVATFYDTDGTGACGYDASQDPLNAAMNVADFEGSQACGAYVEVRAAGGASVTVRITNLCPAPCRVGQLDLNPKAFDRLGARNRGEIPITWKLVSQPSAKQISLRYKDGSSQYWCGIQVIDHRNPVARLEVRAGGSWKRLQRTDYNYFLSENGAGCGGAVAVTDIYGERLVIDPLPVKAGVSQPANRQFAQH
ncbi:expansin EXLX1 family cellulose-binding protein [Amycolatopsis sp. DG1A-15b]|uniref:expansin EXLX1 family cellulose-binding protein n=1 Tax=Amycolatopsis sp. DG1A-15b TaxID=3052846 RepID=UPI00255B773F|nr:expansin EXLX1 family cellulose-binding protein [Amycolatopsis sp. DG1A-15b]WIX90504.1 expansin EXLX1 family cellulose-binding protein [Amycolatopsis sp. DG1A-15b]